MGGVSQPADVALTWGNFRFRLFLSQPQKPCLQRRPRDAPQRAPRASQRDPPGRIPIETPKDPLSASRRRFPRPPCVSRGRLGESLGAEVDYRALGRSVRPFLCSALRPPPVESAAPEGTPGT